MVGFVNLENSDLVYNLVFTVTKKKITSLLDNALLSSCITSACHAQSSFMPLQDNAIAITIQIVSGSVLFVVIWLLSLLWNAKHFLLLYSIFVENKL